MTSSVADLTAPGFTSVVRKARPAGTASPPTKPLTKPLTKSSSRCRWSRAGEHVVRDACLSTNSSPHDVVPQLHNAVVVGLVCREPQVLPLAPGEERGPRAEHNGVDVQDVAVDQVTTGQFRGERATAGIEVAVGLRLQHGYDVESSV